MVNNLVKISQEKKHIIVKGTGGLRGKDGIPGPVGPQGEPGPQGIGVQNVTLAQNDGLDFTLTDGSHRVTASVRGPQGVQGETGPANELTIGTVTKGDTAQATITGDAPNQTLNLVLPKGDQGIQGETGPANTLSIGTVEKGDDASATITGTSPNQTLNLVLPKGDKGDKGDTGEDAPLPEPSGTASGTYIEIENAGPGMDTLKLDGDTKQDTYSGKNIINKNVLAKSTNLTIVQTNTGIKVTKTRTNQYDFACINVPNSSNYLGNTLTLKMNISSSADAVTPYVRVYWTDNSGTVGTWLANLSVDGSKGVKSVKFNIPASIPDASKPNIGLLLYPDFREQSGTWSQFDDIQLEVGSTATAYEPYVGGVASPNPDYPQTVQTVTGAQVVEYHTKNLFNTNTVTNGYRLNSDGTLYGATDFSTTDYIEVKPNTSYAISRGITASTYYLNYCQYDSNKTFIGTRGWTSGNKAIFTTLADTHYLRISDGTINLNTIQLEKGSTATTYEPYQSIKHEINLGKNLCNGTTQWYWVGAAANQVGFSSGNSGLAIVVEPNTNYTISTTVSQPRYRACFADELPTVTAVGYNGEAADNTSKTITINSGNHKYLFVNATELDKVQIEKSSKATIFAPYFEPIELCKIGNYQDYIFKDEGGWKVHKAVGKVVFNGNQDEGWYKTSGGYYQKPLTGAVAFDANPATNAYCDNFTPRSRYFVATEMVDLSINFNGSLAAITYSSISTIESFNSWLSTHNVSVYYQLATPTDTVITNQALIDQLEALRTAKMIEGNCIIENTSENLAGNLDIKYWTWYKGPQGPQGPSGQGAWGTITGDITTQADLQSELSKFALKTTTVNGQAISSNVTLTANDISGISTAGKDGKYTSLTDRPLEETVLTATLSGTTFSATAASPFITTAPAVGDRVLVKFDTMVEEGIFKLSINGETPLDCVLTPQTSVSGDMPMFMETVLEGRVYEFIKTQSGDIYQYECLSEHKKVSTFDLNWSSINGGEQSSDIYGTTEQRIGTWINGKPLYRSVLEFTNTARGISNITTSLKAPIETLCHGYGSYYDASYGWQPLVNCVPDAIQAYSSSFGNVKVNGSGYVTLTLIIGSSRQTTNKIHLVLEYTKTTD